jgi:transposase
VIRGRWLNLRSPARVQLMHPEAMWTWIRQDEANRGERDDRLAQSSQLEDLQRLRKQNAELRRRR